MSAIVDCLQFTAHGPERWVLVHDPRALMAQAEFSWSRAIEEATRFDDVRAASIKADLAALPMLPGDPPAVPMFVRVVHGPEVAPELPRSRPDPVLVAERARRHGEGIAAAEASVEVIVPEPEFETGGAPPRRVRKTPPLKPLKERVAIAKRAAKTRRARRVEADECYRRTAERMGERE